AVAGAVPAEVAAAGVPAAPAAPVVAARPREAQPASASSPAVRSAVAVPLHPMRIIPPVAKEAVFPPKSLLDRRIQLLRDVAERLDALRVVQVLPERDLVGPHADDLAVVEEVARPEQVALVVRAPDLRHESGACLPDALDGHVVDRDACDPGR